MTGLTYVAMGTITIDSWRCYFYNDVDTLIMKADTLVTIFSTFYQPFQCWKMTQITENSYYYYIQSEKQIRINMERITLRDNETITDMTDANVISRLCSDVASVNEYHLLVKDNQEANAAVACPSVFQDDFHYSVNGTCGQGIEQWESCQDTTRMTFNYTLCDTQIAYSSGGSVVCLVSIDSNGVVLTTVWNEDAGTTQYQFTCFMAVQNSMGQLEVSQSPNSCTENQTTVDIPKHEDGTIGVIMVLTPYPTSVCGM
ncbi:uncharacterized protein LOC128228402 isoform X2 [Mya arenaria]|nr:uncharacterized protein LOC128228402 isoform X2 [Mya arenaria]